MFRAFEPGISFWWDLIWQSTAFLTLGIAASAALSRWPARAHRILVLAIVAAIGTPLLSQAIRIADWGLLKQSSQVRLETPDDVAVSNEAMRRPIGFDPSMPPFGRVERSAPSVDTVKSTVAEMKSDPLPTSAIAAVSETIEPRDQSSAKDSRNWSLKPVEALFDAWIGFSVLATFARTISVVRGWRLIRNAIPVQDPELKHAAAFAAQRMGIDAEPAIRASNQMRCPSVWCWSRRPILLIPASYERSDSPIDWTAVFSHEIAHWRRLDHATTMLGEALLCLMPWNPLVWWTKSRLSQFAELSCDDWVLASGIDSADYADSLLKLVPRRGNAMALAAVSTKSGLIARIRHILDDHRSSPRTGTAWTLACGTTAALAVAAIALAQEGAATKPPESERIQLKEKTADTTDGSKQRTAKGLVQGPEGKPVAGAKVYWIAHRKSPLPHVAMPRDDDRSVQPNLVILSRSTTDSNGHFEMNAEFDPESFTRFNGIFSNLVATSPGLGIKSIQFPSGSATQGVTLRMQPEKVISGRLLTPSGMPASGVRVTLDGFQRAEDEIGTDAMFIGMSETDEKIPEYWIQPIKTDSSGRFSLHGVPQDTYATLSFWSADHAVDEVTVTTRDNDFISKGLKGFEIVPVKASFTHTLEPARPVQGRVSDKSTGKPLEGLLVELIPMRRHGGMTFRGRTDADGRYRISGHSTDGTYFTTVYPSSSSGYLDAKNLHEGWPAGAKALEKNFELDKGQIVTGRVIDQDSKLPIAGAAVVYQPALKNPNNAREHDFRNPTITDADGRFSITTLPGEGSLVVESADKSNIRFRAEKIRYGRAAYPHGQLKIDVPKGGSLPPVEIALRKGVKLEAKAIGPDGEAIKNLVAFYPGIDACLIDLWNQGQEFPDGLFRIEGADPEKIYRVFFMALDKHLGAVADLKYDPNRKEPIEIRLQPTATIKGKLVNPDGSPASGGQAGVHLVFSPEPKKLSEIERFDEDIKEFYSNVVGQRNFYIHDRRTGEDGTFEYTAILPGAWYDLGCYASGRTANVSTPILKPGEVYDLGIVTLKEGDR
jgi:beta-lactamase regulating signal transducer with metallopeptidase domain